MGKRKLKSLMASSAPPGTLPGSSDGSPELSQGPPEAISEPSWNPLGTLLILSQGPLQASCLPCAINKGEMASQQSPAGSLQPPVTSQRCSGI